MTFFYPACTLPTQVHLVVCPCPNLISLLPCSRSPVLIPFKGLFSFTPHSAFGRVFWACTGPLILVDNWLAPPCLFEPPGPCFSLEFLLASNFPPVTTKFPVGGPSIRRHGLPSMFLPLPNLPPNSQIILNHFVWLIPHSGLLPRNFDAPCIGQPTVWELFSHPFLAAGPDRGDPSFSLFSL